MHLKTLILGNLLFSSHSKCVLGDGNAEHSPKQVHFVLRHKPSSPNSLNCFTIAINLPLAPLNYFQISAGKDEHYSLFQHIFSNVLSQNACHQRYWLHLITMSVDMDGVAGRELPEQFRLFASLQTPLLPELYFPRSPSLTCFTYSHAYSSS